MYNSKIKTKFFDNPEKRVLWIAIKHTIIYGCNTKDVGKIILSSLILNSMKKTIKHKKNEVAYQMFVNI